MGSIGSMGSMGLTEGILCISCAGLSRRCRYRRVNICHGGVTGGIERPKEILVGAVP